MFIDILQIQNEVKFTAVRSRGPGGQNVNKVSSAAVLNWKYLDSNAVSENQKILIGQKLESFINNDHEINLRSDEFRDLPKNKKNCIDKLATLLRQAFHKPKTRHATKPTHGSKIKKRKFKTKRSEVKKSRQRVF